MNNDLLSGIEIIESNNVENNFTQEWELRILKSNTDL